ncbi:MAG: DUF1320 domain-containing protein [Nitrospinae bacterium]|nr:DUF1320 domain-containing protein [Nitrospinota bacterium]
MSYCVIDDITKKLDERTLIELTDTAGTGTVDAAKVERAIRDADALIDSFVAKHYKTPMSPVPALVADLSATIAIVSLHRFRSVESPAWSQAYDRAMTVLKGVAEGNATLDGAPENPPPADSVASALTFSAPGRVFSRDSLKGM